MTFHFIRTIAPKGLIFGFARFQQTRLLASGKRDMEPSKIGVLTIYPQVMEGILKFRPELKERFIHFDCSGENNPLATEDGRKQMENVEVLLCDPFLLAPFMYDFPKLKWVQFTFAGVDSLLTPIREKGTKPSFLATRCAGMFGQHMAEYVVGQIIARERSFQLLSEKQKEHKWDTRFVNESYRLLPELTIGILGVGDIGKTIARACKNLKMTVFGLKSGDVVPEKTEPFLDKWFARRDLAVLLSKCDYVCNVLPNTPLTTGILSNEMLKHCSTKKSVFINVGRGNVVQDEEIITAVRNGWLGGAILDVFEVEPLPETSPLWDMPEVVITPHCSGVTAAHELAVLFFENLEKFDQGEAVKYVVDWEKGY